MGSGSERLACVSPSDLDDGFDIDEEDGGDLYVPVLRSYVNDNKDEGMDIDEAGDGSIVARVTNTEASRNGDEDYKASETTRSRSSPKTATVPAR